MAENDKETEEKQVKTNPDLEKETEGMVDLSDVLSGGETGDMEGSEASESEIEEVDLFKKEELDESQVEFVAKPGIGQKIYQSVFPEESKQREILESSSAKLGEIFVSSKERATKLRERSLIFIKEDSKKILAQALIKLKFYLGKLTGLVRLFRSLSWKLKLLFVAIIGVAVITFKVGQKALDGYLLPELPEVYHINFNEVADKKYSIEKDAKWENFRNAVRFPEYIFRLDRLIVMLKPSQFSGSAPMGVFALYYEASSAEAATEIKVREPEIRDLSARTLEGITYDQIRSAEGKEKAKKALIQNLNKILNQGKLVNIYFKDFVLKP